MNINLKTSFRKYESVPQSYENYCRLKKFESRSQETKFFFNTAESKEIDASYRKKEDRVNRIYRITDYVLGILVVTSFFGMMYLRAIGGPVGLTSAYLAEFISCTCGLFFSTLAFITACIAKEKEIKLLTKEKNQNITELTERKKELTTETKDQYLLDYALSPGDYWVSNFDSQEQGLLFVCKARDSGLRLTDFRDITVTEIKKLELLKDQGNDLREIIKKEIPPELGEHLLSDEARINPKKPLEDTKYCYQNCMFPGDYLDLPSRSIKDEYKNSHLLGDVDKLHAIHLFSKTPDQECDGKLEMHYFRSEDQKQSFLRNFSVTNIHGTDSQPVNVKERFSLLKSFMERLKPLFLEKKVFLPIEYKEMDIGLVMTYKKKNEELFSCARPVFSAHENLIKANKARERQEEQNVLKLLTNTQNKNIIKDIVQQESRSIFNMSFSSSDPEANAVSLDLQQLLIQHYQRYYGLEYLLLEEGDYWKIEACENALDYEITFIRSGDRIEVISQDQYQEKCKKNIRTEIATNGKIPESLVLYLFDKFSSYESKHDLNSWKSKASKKYYLIDLSSHIDCEFTKFYALKVNIEDQKEILYFKSDEDRVSYEKNHPN
ncbi:MAG: hypothetical protein R3E91_02935 [Chlamydiales bacterium]